MTRSPPSSAATRSAGPWDKSPAATERTDYLTHCVELLAPLGLVRTRRMFGGQGITLDDLFIAIVLRDRLYLKADEVTRQRFRDAGCHELSYEMQGTRKTLGYWTVPDDALEAPPAMAAWDVSPLTRRFAPVRVRHPDGERRPQPRRRPASGHGGRVRRLGG